MLSTVVLPGCIRAETCLAMRQETAMKSTERPPDGPYFAIFVKVISYKWGVVLVSALQGLGNRGTASSSPHHHQS